VLGYKEGEIADIAFKDTHLKQENIGGKLEILDIKAKLSNGSVIDIEMQSRCLPDIRSRISYYESNMITEQIGEGGSYSDLKPVKSIIVADFDFIPESEKCHTVFQMLEKDEHFPFSDLEEIHVLSLKKLSELKQENLLEWLKFISSESKEDFMQLASSNPVLKKAVDVLSAVSADESNRMLYEARLKEWRDNKSRIDGARKEGMLELRALLRQGHSLDAAEKMLGLDNP
jgi:predicted transposase/invertase (TIGR01784 family)